MSNSLNSKEKDILKTLRNKQKMSRKDKVQYLSIFIHPESSVGLEIGPNLTPLFSKKSGFQVNYLETVSTNELKRRVQDSGKDSDLVEEIDFVFQRGKNLVENIEKYNYYDYVVSSHVVEHIPDFVSHLQEVSIVLKDSGILGLIIPDKRLCFDFLKPHSTLGQVLQAYVEKRTEPPISSCIDEIRYGSRLKDIGKGAWDVNDSGYLYPKYENYYSKLDKMLSNTGRLFSEKSFVHTWFFTCDSFLSIFNDLQNLNLTDFSLIDIHPTGHMDFIAILGKKDSSHPKMSYKESLEVLKSKNYFEEQDIRASEAMRTR